MNAHDGEQLRAKEHERKGKVLFGVVGPPLSGRLAISYQLSAVSYQPKLGPQTTDHGPGYFSLLSAYCLLISNQGAGIEDRESVVRCP